MRGAIEAYLKDQEKHAAQVALEKRNPWRFYRYSEMPHYFATAARLLQLPLSSFLAASARYSPRLCHRCNKMPVFAPHGFSLHEILYDFSPYVLQQQILYGVDRFGSVTAAERCPEKLVGLSASQRLRSIEEQVLRDFGFPKRGINNRQETLLALTVQRLFPVQRIIRRHRPPWLGRLELDVVVEDLSIAFEFQGMQHQRPMEHLGGQESFDKLQARDARKAKLCAENGYKLIPIYEGDELPLEAAVRRGLSNAKVAENLPVVPHAISVPWDFTIKSKTWSGRWTNSDNQCFLQTTSLESEWSASGFDIHLDITLEEAHVKIISIATGGESMSKFSMAFTPSDQPVIHQHRNSCSAREFFLIWATLDPRVTIRQSGTSIDSSEVSQLRIPLMALTSKQLPRTPWWSVDPAATNSSQP